MRFSIKRISKALMFLVCTGTLIVFLHGQTSSNMFLHFLEHTNRLLDMMLSNSINTCACHKCITELEDDPWFIRHLNQSLNPFLTRANKEIPEDTIKWWKTLQKDHGDFSKAIEELFEVIPDRELYMDAGPDRCRTCAVVGNSGNLKGSHYGAHIDLNDVIIRMNKAPTKGYEEDVGTRTTHHVMYPESAVDLDNTTRLVLFPFKTLDFQWLRSALTIGSKTFKKRIKANKDLVMVLHPTFMKYVHEIWLEEHGRYPSTGFLSLIFAIHICDEVNVYGFGADRDGNWHHYWHPLNKFRRTGPHGGNHEYNVTMQLVGIQKLQFFQGL